MKESLWVEKYRPKTLGEYVFTNESHKAKMEEFVRSKEIPHLLFDGPPGTGKTTAALVLIDGISTDPYDVLKINASRENNVDTMRNKITNFVETMPFGKFKVVFLDEADFISPNAQAALRGIMEMYASSSRFILTCNYPNKVIPAIHSRTQRITIEKLDLTDFTTRMAKILLDENIEFELDILDDFVRASYPDMRKCLNNLQLNCIGGKLVIPTSAGDSTDAKLEYVTLIKQGKIREARQLICKQFRPDDMEELITWAYNNLDLFAKTEEQKDEAILVIRKAAVNASLVADAEINISAMMTELGQITK